MQGIGVFTLDGCNRDLVVTPVGSPPEKFATLLRMSSPPDHRFRMLFKKNGDSALTPADIADIRIFRTGQYQLSALETFGLDSAGITADTVYSENSDFYMVSRRFSVSSVSSQPNLLGGSLGMIVNVVLRPSPNSSNGSAEGPRRIRPPRAGCIPTSVRRPMASRTSTFHSLTADDFEVIELGWGAEITGVP